MSVLRAHDELNGIDREVNEVERRSDDVTAENRDDFEKMQHKSPNSV